MPLTASDLAACEREPIHIPGAIQPHGALLVVATDEFTIQQVSESVVDLLGVPTEQLLGQPLGSLLDEEAIALIRTAGPEPEALAAPVLVGQGVSCHVGYHCNGQVILVELEPESPDEPIWDAAATANAAFRRLEAAHQLEELASALCDEIRRVSGFDRVIVYRFDSDWNGQVIAEVRAEEMQSYLGLYFPAADIPAQARRLYLGVRVRAVPDVGYRPSAICSLTRSEQPIDLSSVSFRSVSPNCLEFLENMGVRAMLGLSLIIGGKLWGLVTCHHRTPRRVPPKVRRASLLIGQMASLRLASLLEAEGVAGRETARRFAKQAVRGIIGEGDLLATAAGVEADGVAVLRGGKVYTGGRTPPAESLPGLFAWVLLNVSRDVYATDRFGEVCPLPLRDATGILTLTVTRDPDFQVIWFRQEIPRKLRWGGNPTKTSGPSRTGYGPRPRTSFTPWEEALPGRSAEWTAVQIDAVSHLRELVLLAEARRAERLARRAAASDALFRAAFESTGVGKAITKANAEFLKVNVAFGQLLGCDPDDLVGRTDAEYTHPDDQRQGEQARQSLRDGAPGPFTYDSRYRHRSGRTVFVTVTVAAVQSSQGEPEFYVLQAQDVSERTWGERLLSAEARAVALLADAPKLEAVTSPILAGLGELLGYDRAECWQADPNGSVLACEAVWERGKVAPTLPHESARAGVAVGRAFETGETQVGPNGIAVPVRIGPRTATVLYLAGTDGPPDGPALRTFAHNLGSTLGRYLSHRTVEDALRASEARFQAFLRHLPHPVWVKDESGRYKVTNPAFDFSFPGESGSALGRTDTQAFSPDIATALRRNDKGVFDSNRSLSGEMEVPSAAGARWYAVVKFPFVGPDGRRLLGGVGVDITARVSAVRAMDEARIAADTANRAKTTFLANVSHELRTPLGGILGMVDLLLGDELPADVRDRLSVIRSSAERLKALVNDLLDVARIEADRMELAAIPFDLREVVNSALAPMVVQAQRKGLTANVEIGLAVPRAVVGDPHRLAQVLVNLFGNALKFTERGRISVIVGVEDGEHDSARLRFEVIDTGIGIAADKLEAVFEPFVQADPGLARRFEGSGLGLGIARRLVELMGARLEVRSRVGHGTTFWFTVRFAVPAEPPPGENSPASKVIPISSQPLAILVADDQPVNLRVVGEILRKAGHKVATASDGLEAVEVVRREQFDVILMDVQMPGLDGFQASALIRSQEQRTGRRVPIIALTARAMPGDREECLRAGMDDVVTKPIEWPVLYRAISEVVASRVAPTPPAAGRAASDVIGEYSELLTRFGGDIGLLAEVADVFAADAPKLMAEIHAAVRADAPKAVASAAHKLVGLAASLNLETLVRAARHTEELVRKNELAGLAAATEVVERALAEANDSVEKLLARCRVNPTDTESPSRPD